jgi:hypothetical protein
VLVSAHLFDYLRALRIESLSALRKQRPMAPGIVRHLIERSPFDFATEVEKRNAELVTELEAAAIPEQGAAA